MLTSEDIDRLTAETVQFIREKTAQELGALFAKHGIPPQNGTFFSYPLGRFGPPPCGCCGVGIVVLEAFFPAADKNYHQFMGWVASDAHGLHGDIRAFARGFDGEKSIDETERAMFDKGKRVWDLATQTKEQA